jgi:hypothetical protein
MAAHRLDNVIEAANATGVGLTLGVAHALLVGVRNRVLLVVTCGFSDSKEAFAAASEDRHQRERTDRDTLKIKAFVLQRTDQSVVLWKSCA